MDMRGFLNALVLNGYGAIVEKPEASGQRLALASACPGFFDVSLPARPALFFAHFVLLKAFVIFGCRSIKLGYRRRALTL